MRWLFALVLAAAVLALDARRDAAAQWCAQYDPYTYTCGFVSFNQCMDTVRGVGGICRPDYQARAVRNPDRQPDAPTQRQRPRTPRECGSISNPNC